ncbi:MAG: 16S rRNA (guanine(966)-N(2))-methyltransferase RsmD [Clostridia bacterium]|nr:16S rRNA (guanine(966)-N(2))-methyltransferase RsmD [Clostridia bacterium]
MRIVAGKFRAKKLAPPTHNIRPTLDKVKQALFTRLQFDIEGAVVLDLFSGSGALGIEAISRGARQVIFCDVDEKSVALTKKNLSGLKIDAGQEVRVFKTDFLAFLRGARTQFNIIILDPPYEKNFYVPALEIIAQKKLLAPDGVIVCERLRAQEIPQDFFALDATKNYGTVALDYLVWKDENCGKVDNFCG